MATTVEDENQSEAASWPAKAAPFVKTGDEDDNDDDDVDDDNDDEDDDMFTMTVMMIGRQQGSCGR